MLYPAIQAQYWYSGYATTRCKNVSLNKVCKYANKGGVGQTTIKPLAQTLFNCNRNFNDIINVQLIFVFYWFSQRFVTFRDAPAFTITNLWSCLVPTHSAQWGEMRYRGVLGQWHGENINFLNSVRIASFSFVGICFKILRIILNKSTCCSVFCHCHN